MSVSLISSNGAGEAANSRRYQQRRVVFESQLGKVKLTSLEKALEKAEIDEWKIICEWCLEQIDEHKVDEKYGFIFAYTFDHGDPSMREKNPYRFINNALITGQTLSVFKTSSFLFGLLHALRSLPYTQFSCLYRGIPEKTEWEAETPKVWSAFTSMSLDIEVAKRFLGGTETAPSGTLFRAKGLRGYYIAEFSMIPEEKEVLLEPFQSIYAESVENDGKLISVDIIDGGMTKFIAVDKVPQTNLPTVEVSEELFNALDLHNEGKHTEAAQIYEKEASKGNQIACFNLGNCKMFGVGAKLDIMIGLDLWMRGGHVEKVNLELFKKFSNFKFMGKSEIVLSGLFLFFQNTLF